MDRELSKQEEDFVSFLVAGQSQRVAYRHAFKQSKNWKDKTVDEKASRLFKLGKVQARYNDLLKDAKDRASNMATWSRYQAFSEFEWLKNKAKKDIEEEGVRQANSNAFLSAVDGMNRMASIESELADKKLAKDIQLLEMKINELSHDAEEIGDDGFLEALRDEGEELWSEE